MAELAHARPTARSRSTSILPPIYVIVATAEGSDVRSGNHFDAPAWRRRLRVAQGQEPADLVLAGGEIVDVFGGDTYQADVAIVDGVIAGVGSYPRAEERLDVAGKWVCPVVHRRARPHRERAGLAAGVRPRRRSARHRRGRHRSPRDRQRRRAGGHGGDARRRARIAARHLLHGAVLRTGQPLGITGGCVWTGRDGGDAGMAGVRRTRRADEFPRSARRR